jgi:four helix bundle protein
MRLKSYKDLIVWRRSIELVKAVYLLTSKFPTEERFGLVNQMRRSAVSVPSNIAEGQARRSTADFLRFLSMAGGSLAELETQLIIARELEFADPTQHDDISAQVFEVQKMLSALQGKLKERL